MFSKIGEKLVNNKLNLALVSGVVVLIIGGWFGYQRLVVEPQNATPVEEVDLAFDPEGPYAVLTPRNDGNAMILNLKRTASYEAISYELAYNAEGIDRGVVGEINTKERKGEYSQEILFGTCSKNVCKYDAGVENGTLTLHIQKGREAYRTVTTWHLQKPEVILGNLASGDTHFVYKISSGAVLSLVGYTIINDLSGAPKLPVGKMIVGKVYHISAPSAKDLPEGEVIIELAENPLAGSKIFQFKESENSWQELETIVTGSKLSASATSGGIFAVLTPEN